MDFIANNIWFILFIVCVSPLIYYRSKFRKMVYQSTSRNVFIKPVFRKEIKAFFRNGQDHNQEYKKVRNIYRFWMAICLILIGTFFMFNANTKKMDKLAVGNTVPPFELEDQHGKLFSLDSVLGKKNLVIFFYPKDDSPGCTKEACSFRDQFEVFAEADALIIGISSQSVESHMEFANKYRLNYTLLSDPKNEVRNTFGVPANLFGFIPGRVTYVIDKEGKIAYLFNSQTRAEEHVQMALSFLQEMNN